MILETIQPNILTKILQIEVSEWLQHFEDFWVFQVLNVYRDFYVTKFSD